MRTVSRSSPVLGPECTVLARIKYRCPSDMADELFTQMCNTYDELEAIFGGCNKYLQRAIEYARSICAGRFDSEYVINRSDITFDLGVDIEIPIMLDDIICDVMFRIYNSNGRDLRLMYFRYIQGRKLRWRLED